MTSLPDQPRPVPTPRRPLTTIERVGLDVLYGLLCIVEWLSGRARASIHERLFPDDRSRTP